jgi:hypothetical protein
MTEDFRKYLEVFSQILAALQRKGVRLSSVACRRNCGTGTVGNDEVGAHLTGREDPRGRAEKGGQNCLSG